MKHSTRPQSIHHGAAFGSLVLAFTLAPTAAIAGIAEPQPEIDPVVGGVRAEDGELDAVVSLRTANQLCTGSLVSPTIVMTAAHCLDDVPEGSPITVQMGSDANSDRTVVSERFDIHPQYCELCTEERYDFAFVEVAEPQVPLDGYLLPIISQTEWNEAMSLGRVVLVAGFGTDDPLDNTAITTPTKRKVTATISDFTSQGFEFFAGGGGRDSCSGDSGGPAIVQLGNGVRRLAGVTSRGKVPCGDGGWYGVPYAALLWLDSHAGTELGCPYGGACLDTTQTGAEEGRCSVGPHGSRAPWLLVVLGLWSRRRSRRR